MTIPLTRLLLIVGLVLALAGVAVVVTADASPNTTADDEFEVDDRMAAHMGDHMPGEHHDRNHEHHHGDHADQHSQHHQQSGHC